MEADKELRVSVKKTKVSDFVFPTLSLMSSYSFIAFRFPLPSSIDQVVYYLAWFVLGVSVLSFLKVFIDLIETN